MLTYAVDSFHIIPVDLGRTPPTGIDRCDDIIKFRSVVFTVVYAAECLQTQAHRIRQHLILSDLKGENGGIGLMQLTPDEFAMIQTDILGVPPEDKGFLYDPQKNLQCGAAYLSYLYQRYGVWETVFAAFDAGIATVDAWLATPEYVTEFGTLKNIPEPGTARFVRDVIKARELYIKLYF